MAIWKKANEAWFGDTFNRDAMLCSGEIAYDTALDSDCTAAKVSWNDNNAITSTCNGLEINKDALEQVCGNTYKIADSINITRDRFDELQAQINELKEKLETKKENLELRSALKTLHYKREVE